MAKYTMIIRGEPVEDAVIALDGAEGIKAPSLESWSTEPGSDGSKLSVTVDAPSLPEAKQRVADALPEHGSYTVARPEALEDDEERSSWL